MNKTERLRAALAGEEDLDALLSSWAPDVKAIATAEARRVGVHRPHELDEVVALAWTEVARMIDDERSGISRAVYRFDAHLVMRLRNAVRLWTDSEAGHAPAAGMSSVLRRRRAIQRMTNHGLTPTEAVEILTASRHKDGVYSLADLQIEVTTRDIDDEALQVPAPLDPGELAELMMGPEAGYVVAPFEGRVFVEAVVAVVADVDSMAAQVVQSWLETVWAGDEATTVASLARKLKISRGRVLAALVLGRRLATVRLTRMDVHVGQASDALAGERT